MLCSHENALMQKKKKKKIPHFLYHLPTTPMQHPAERGPIAVYDMSQPCTYDMPQTVQGHTRNPSGEIMYNSGCLYARLM